ncbi:MAG TPA: hypothetical protein DCW72_07580 [Elusimicrobia bacterium]|nr:MAG: hypothetical protein A2X29_05690 [Elusimicrobia bacterium GWA2_64_40]OGR67024.1 MAG: hypothetical protein A2X30_06060 [Elusimicrobia bacterium GWB2_63_16]HAN03876.1 hypothetical protein [Elusimicrobiota bacterium]HAU90072.1 hypothetical protein [Elusimicrobiota bacterium]
MFKTAAFLSVIFFPALSLAGSFELGSYSAGTLPQAPVVQPHGPAPVTPPGVTIANYTTEEEFTFESEAEEALSQRVNALRAAGVTTLGGRVTEKGNDYTFVIEYLPSVKGSAALPPAALVETYKNGEAYWLTSEAEEAMRAAAANFRAARLAVLGSYLYDSGNDDAFAVDYVVKNLLRPSQEYAVKFEKYAGGKFTFESEAEKAVPSYLALFKQAGLPAIRGRAVPRPDRDYAVEVEYAVKTNASGRRPQYSVARYDARTTFPFDKEAAKAGKAALPAFARAGLPPLSSVVRPAGRDYSYAVDFLVGNIYQQGGVIPSAAVQTYQAPETFTFEREAEEALAAKTAAFNAAGLPVLGSAVTGSLGSYTYVLDYAAKAGQNGPAQQPL